MGKRSKTKTKANNSKVTELERVALALLKASRNDEDGKSKQCKCNHGYRPPCASSAGESGDDTFFQSALVKRICMTTRSPRTSPRPGVDAAIEFWDEYYKKKTTNKATTSPKKTEAIVPSLDTSIAYLLALGTMCVLDDGRHDNTTSMTIARRNTEAGDGRHHTTSMTLARRIAEAMVLLQSLRDATDAQVSIFVGNVDKEFQKLSQWDRQWISKILGLDSDRAVIRFFAKQQQRQSSSCTCLHEKKTQAKAMEKTGLCSYRVCLKRVKYCALMDCAGCHMAQYCSKACQQANWPMHKQVCHIIKARQECEKLQ
jgi:hypothetical protein